MFKEKVVKKIMNIMFNIKCFFDLMEDLNFL